MYCLPNFKSCVHFRISQRTATPNMLYHTAPPSEQLGRNRGLRLAKQHASWILPRTGTLHIALERCAVQARALVQRLNAHFRYSILRQRIASSHENCEKSLLNRQSHSDWGVAPCRLISLSAILTDQPALTVYQSVARLYDQHIDSRALKESVSNQAVISLYETF